MRSMPARRAKSACRETQRFFLALRRGRATPWRRKFSPCSTGTPNPVSSHINLLNRKWICPAFRGDFHPLGLPSRHTRPRAGHAALFPLTRSFACRSRLCLCRTPAPPWPRQAPRGTMTLSRDLTRKREGVTAPGCSLPGQRLFCPPCRHTRPRAGHTALFPFT